MEAPRARFLAGWAPSVPREPPSPAAASSPPAPPPAPVRALHASDVFLECALAVVVATTESYQFFSEEDIRHGFEEEHRYMPYTLRSSNRRMRILHDYNDIYDRIQLFGILSC